MSSTPQDASSSSAVHLVIQRFRRCSLLVDESKVVTVGEQPEDGGNDAHHLLSHVNQSSVQTVSMDNSDQHPPLRPTGLLVYVSFSKAANRDKVKQAATTLLNLPVVTVGSWGDGSSTKSMLQMASAIDKSRQSNSNSSGDNRGDKGSDGIAHAAPSNKALLFLVIVPQANLISKVKSQGKSIQYHQQIDKALGKELYEYFVESLNEIIFESQCQARGLKNPASTMTSSQASATLPDPSIPPSQLFELASQHKGLYGEERDADGIPTTNIMTGETLTKSAKKKLRKALEAHAKRHAKYVSKQPSRQNGEAVQGIADTPGGDENASSTIADSGSSDSLSNPMAAVDPSFVTLVAGTFGKRQGLSISSDMGPFCHIVHV